ncbi:hypothetical protein [Cellulomonas oligotrophica]|nr:hypothetical protein [Cellulomonas oligotrophica]NYD87792.1 hypothetical protein [Cellulomonas oligotrophica]
MTHHLPTPVTFAAPPPRDEDVEETRAIVRVPGDEAFVYATTIPQDPGELYVSIETRTSRSRLVVHAADTAAALAVLSRASARAARNRFRRAYLDHAKPAVPAAGALTEGQVEALAAASWTRQAGTSGVQLGAEKWHERHRHFVRADVLAAGIEIVEVPLLRERKGES